MRPGVRGVVGIEVEVPEGDDWRQEGEEIHECGICDSYEKGMT